MRNRLTALLMLLLLALGAVACDETADGIGEDAEDIEQGLDEAEDD